MKTRFLMLFLSVLFLGACSDDDAKSATDQLRFDGQSYPINLVQYDSFDASQANFTLMFYPNGTHSLQLAFPGITEMPDGNYTFRPIGDPDFDPDVHFSGGGLYISPANEPVSITGGSVRFSKKGEEYKITFDVETTAGRVKGNYDGPLTQI